MAVIIDEVVTEVEPEAAAPRTGGEERQDGTCDPREILRVVARAERRKQRLHAD